MMEGENQRMDEEKKVEADEVASPLSIQISKLSARIRTLKSIYAEEDDVGEGKGVGGRDVDDDGGARDGDDEDGGVRDDGKKVVLEKVSFFASAVTVNTWVTWTALAAISSLLSLYT